MGEDITIQIICTITPSFLVSSVEFEIVDN